MILNKKIKNIALFSHDAGGAEILSNWALNHNYSYIGCLKGPALNIFEKNNCKFQYMAIEEALEKCDLAICSTSWNSELEKKAISKARSKEKYIISLLDHWVNYKERFIMNDKNIYPNEIWVSDIYAFNLAKKEFPKIKIKLVENFYLKKRKEFYLNLKKEIGNGESNVLLFLSENISQFLTLNPEQRYHIKYDEFGGFEFLLKNLNIFPKKIKKIIIRPHPSDEFGKYDFLKRNTNLTIDISTKKFIHEDILEAEFVVGCTTMALIEGLLAGKKVYSCIPPNSNFFPIPYKEIKLIREIKNVNI